MRSVILVFPGSNCDRDIALALKKMTGQPPLMLWHKETELPPCDLIVIPGGFSYGDYLRPGAIAARSPLMADVRKRAEDGVSILGICNGFQILTELGLLPGTLMRNACLHFVCQPQKLLVANTTTRFTKAYQDKKNPVIPIAHHDGNYQADQTTLERLEGEGRIVFRYQNNPNGSARDIAGIINKNGNVIGMMPHPERAVEHQHGGVDGRGFFESLTA